MEDVFREQAHEADGMPDDPPHPSEYEDDRPVVCPECERDDCDCCVCERVTELEAALRKYGNHVPPCARWVTKGSPDLNPCTCGFADYEPLEERR